MGKVLVRIGNKMRKTLDQSVHTHWGLEHGCGHCCMQLLLFAWKFPKSHIMLNGETWVRLILAHRENKQRSYQAVQ